MTVDAESFPKMTSVSAGHWSHRVLVCTRSGPPPEMILTPMPDAPSERTAVGVCVAEWNLYWEGGPYRPDDMRIDVPPSLAWLHRVAERDVDAVLVPVEGKSEYDAYAPLYHLLPQRILARHRLPIVRGGIWPRLMPLPSHRLPESAIPRLQRAFAELVWPLLTRGRSAPSSHGPDDSILLLAKNLGFWLPAMEVVLRRRGLRWGRADVTAEDKTVFARVRGRLPPDLDIQTAARGGPLWEGEEEARDVLEELVDVADEHGRLRATVDAIRSHRVEEDFSDRWSREREDFERKLYSKRSRVRTTFVQLDGALPLLGSESQVEGNTIWRDLIAVVNPRDRRVVVCLARGQTAVGDVAKELGYANHSPVSKALARIRAAAVRLLGR